jgi:acetyl-CoA C-acetyltransferase
MSRDNDVVMVAAARTPIAKFGGALKEVRATTLVAHVMKEVIRRAAPLDAGQIDEVIAGDCIQCPDEANTARTGALLAGIPVEVPAYTIQRQCTSSMQALVSGAQQITSGNAEVVLVCGVESMSSAPYYLGGARWGLRLMNGEVTDSLMELLHSGSRILGEPMIMGITAENLAKKYGISREEQDEFALESHRRAEAAIKEGRFKEEIVPFELPGKKKEVFAQDEHPRFGLTMEDLVRLKPVFLKDGTVTAGNSSGLNDGAAAAIIMSRAKARELGLQPMARVVASAAAGVEPHLMGYGPVPSTEKALRKAGMTLKDIGLIEINEAFAAQVIACERGLGMDRSITNCNGGGVGLGHPVGATGLRIMITLVHEMARRNVELGLATLCAGGGMGMSVVLARD